MREPFTKFIQSELKDDAVLITCGLPASCKTGLAEEAQRVKGYPVISTDSVRAEVLAGEDIFDEAVAADMAKRQRVYDEVFQRADAAAAVGKGVIIDATFITQLLRRRAAQLAHDNQRPLVIMQTVCPQAVCLARIARRTRQEFESNALSEQAYLNNKARFEEVNLDDFKRLYPDLSILHLMVDTQYDRPENWYVTGVTRR